MRGLYVYGGLLMAFDFASGVYLDGPALMAGTIVACGASALGEVAAELVREAGSETAMRAQVPLALASWLITAAVTAGAALSLIGAI